MGNSLSEWMKCGESGGVPPKRQTLGWHGQEGRALRIRMVHQLQCDKAEAWPFRTGSNSGLWERTAEAGEDWQGRLRKGPREWLHATPRLTVPYG